MHQFFHRKRQWQLTSQSSLPQNLSLVMSTNHELLCYIPYTVVTKPLHRKICLKPDFNIAINAPILPSPLCDSSDVFSAQAIVSLTEQKINPALPYHRLFWWFMVEQAFNTSIVHIPSRDTCEMREKMFTCIDSQVSWVISDREKSPLPSSPGKSLHPQTSNAYSQLFIFLIIDNPDFLKDAVIVDKKHIQMAEFIYKCMK